MQASVAAEIRWRLDLYGEALGLCRRGGFSFGRLLALVPDRLRLAVGDRGARIEVPVAVTRGLRARVQANLPRGQDGPRPTGQAELRRFIRLAQVHPDVDARALRGWLEQGAPRLLDALARVYRRALDEVGRGEGGIEAAYLVHLTLLQVLREALDEIHAGDGARALVAALAPQGLARAAEASAGAGAMLPARFGMQTALTGSLEAMGVEAEAWCRLPANPRRTTPQALELARRVVTAPFETMPLPRVVDTVARRLLADPESRTRLATDLLAEQVRDALLLMGSSLAESESEEALDVVSSSRALRRAVFVPHRRAELLRWLARPAVREHRAAATLRRLLEGAAQVEGGDPSPLGVHSDLPRRAELAARGALLAALDAHTEPLRKDVTRVVRRVPDEAQEDLHSAGRCYRLGLDDAPLYQLPDAAREAALWIDLSAVTGALARWPARRAAGLLERRLIGPVLERAHRLPGVMPAGASADRVGFRGAPGPLAELAQFSLRCMTDLQAEVREGPEDVLGGRDEVEAERRQARAQLDARLSELEQALSRVSADQESVRLLSDSRALLETQRDALEGALEAEPMPAPVLSMALTFGEVAEALPSAPQIAVSGPLTEGAGLLTRAPEVGRARAARLAMTREARGDGQVELPFRVCLGQGGGLFNVGCVLTDAARAALEASVVGGVVRVRVLELRELPGGLRARLLFDRDPEHLRVTFGAEGGARHAVRAVGRRGEADLWELLPADLELIAACFPPPEAAP